MNAFSIHAHFYQPPREDPLTGYIPIEPSASPYSNWNERIHNECYRPNADLRNFEHISFNIGPTLFSWMKKYDPDTCQKIVEQDHSNQKRSHLGNAIAQAYNHTILPLGSYQDKITQVYWGIADFHQHFSRLPRGLWLPETAADYETLEVLARLGIQFTILAPWQAAIPGINPTKPYLVQLPDRQEISVFFYQRELSARISFDSLATVNADHFVREILSEFFQPEKNSSREHQILLLASDGELYGHHKPQREHFLARLVDGASNGIQAHPTLPAVWLSQHPAKERIGIDENTSWSCHHGIERWRRSCACTPGDGDWKANFRDALDHLASEIDLIYLDVMQPLFKDPWQVRNRYIHVLLGQINIDTLFCEYARRTLTSEESHRAHLMLEAQRERQRMFTSCGWFFEDFDRIEPRNNVAYAAQAVRLTALATNVNLESQTSFDLRKVTSERTRIRADMIFEHHLRRAEGVQEMRIGYAD